MRFILIPGPADYSFRNKNTAGEKLNEWGRRFTIVCVHAVNCSWQIEWMLNGKIFLNDNSIFHLPTSSRDIFPCRNFVSDVLALGNSFKIIKHSFQKHLISSHLLSGKRRRRRGEQDEKASFLASFTWLAHLK